MGVTVMAAMRSALKSRGVYVLSVVRKGKMPVRRMLILPWQIVFQTQHVMSQGVMHETRTLHGFFQ